MNRIFQLLILGVGIWASSSGSVAAQWEDGNAHEDSLKRVIATDTGRHYFKALSFLGDYYYERSDAASISRSLECFRRIVREADSAGRPIYRGHAQMKIGVIYETFSELNGLDLAVKHCKLGLETMRKYKVKSAMVSCYICLASTYSKKSDHRQALAYIDSALALPDNLTSTTVQSLKMKGRLLAQENRLEEARNELEKALILSKKDNRYSLPEIYLNLCGLENRMGNYQRSLELTREWETALDTANLANASAFYQTRADIFAKMLLFDSAFYYRSLERQVNYKLAQKEGKDKLLELHVKYETELKEAENQQLIQKADIASLQFALALALALALAAGAALFYFRNRALRRAALHDKELADQTAKTLNVELSLSRAAVEEQARAQQLLAAEHEALQYRSRLAEKESEIERQEALLRQHRLETEAATQAYRLNERQTVFKDVRRRIEDILEAPSRDRVRALQDLKRALTIELSESDDWEQFRRFFEQSRSGFFDRLGQKHPDLTPTDLKIVAYILMNKSSKEMAELLGVSHASVNTARSRLRKRLELETDEGLFEYLNQI